MEIPLIYFLLQISSPNIKDLSAWAVKLQFFCPIMALEPESNSLAWSCLILNYKKIYSPLFSDDLEFEIKVECGVVGRKISFVLFLLNYFVYTSMRTKN